MSSWEALKDLVASALDLPPDERTAFLKKNCTDKQLLQDAISLAAQGDSEDEPRLLDRRADAFMGLASTDPAGLVGRQMGKYILLRLVGQGGMGAVYLAKQRGVDRNVAVKVVPPHALMFDARSRFEREIQALGRINHRGVARVYDFGLHVEMNPPGLAPIPFFAMEWVDGLPLTSHVVKHSLSLRDRLQLMVQVADAVQAAHQRAVVHCDLKPANVLVLPPDAAHPAGAAKIVDFGLSRLMETGVGNVTAAFTSGSVMGTLAYMAPEQARGDQDEIEFRTDVYALGALLHEVVHGAPPVDIAGLPLTEALRRLSDPSHPRLKIVDDITSGDLAHVLAMALAPEKERRYSSADAFAQDLRRLLSCQPIVAQPPTARYKARKFIRRNRLGVLAAGGMLAALVIGCAVATVGLLRERDARLDSDAATQVANRERRKAESVRDFLRYIVSSAEPGESGRDVTVVDAVRAALPAIERYADGDPAAESDLRLTVAQTFRQLAYPEEARTQYVRAHELASAAHGPNSEQAIGIAIEQAVAFANSGDIEASAKLLKTLPGRIAKLEGEHATARATAMLGEAHANLLCEQGEYDRAAQAYERILSQRGNEPNLIDEENLEIWRMNFALALSYAGRLRDAEAAQREILEDSIRRRGSDHLRTLVAQQNLAGTLVDLGEFDEARAMLDHVIETGKPIWGAQHPDLLATRRSVAALEFSRANFSVASDIAGEVLEEARQIFPPDAPFLLLAENIHAAALLGDRDWERGLPAMRNLVDRLTRLYGHDDPSTLTNRASLAQALGTSGDKHAAAAEMREILPLQRASTGDKAQGTLITQNNLGMLELELGNTQRALDLLSASLAGAIEVELWPLVPRCRRNLGRALTTAKHYEEAELALLKAYEEAINEAEQHKTAQAIADLYTAWGKIAEASRWTLIAGDAG